MPSHLCLSSTIDYPYGLSDTKIRQHQTLSIIRRGAKAIDLIVNPVYLINNKRHALIDDIEANRIICSENGVIFRVMLEYRHFEEEVYYDMIKLCRMLKIQYIFPSSGHFIDDYMDNLITCKIIKSQYPNAKLITNGNIWQREHYELIERSDVYGMRIRAGYDINVLVK